MVFPSRAYADVYQVLDDICFGSVSPAGARGMLFTAIDQLRRDQAPQEHIHVAERISIALHKLDWAALRKDQRESEFVRQELRTLGACWHQMPMVTPCPIEAMLQSEPSSARAH